MALKIRRTNGCRVTGDFLFFRTSEKVLEVNKITYVPAKSAFFTLEVLYLLSVTIFSFGFASGKKRLPRANIRPLRKKALLFPPVHKYLFLLLRVVNFSRV